MCCMHLGRKLSSFRARKPGNSGSSCHAEARSTQDGLHGHICRMPDNRVPKRLLFGEVKRQAITGRSAQALQGHPEGLPEMLQYKLLYLGEFSTDPLKLESKLLWDL